MRIVQYVAGTCVLVKYVENCKNVYGFYNENIVVFIELLVELLFDKLSYKTTPDCILLKLS